MRSLSGWPQPHVHDRYRYGMQLHNPDATSSNQGKVPVQCAGNPPEHYLQNFADSTVLSSKYRLGLARRVNHGQPTVDTVMSIALRFHVVGRLLSSRLRWQDLHPRSRMIDHARGKVDSRWRDFGHVRCVFDKRGSERKR